MHNYSKNRNWFNDEPASWFCLFCSHWFIPLSQRGRRRFVTRWQLWEGDHQQTRHKSSRDHQIYGRIYQLPSWADTGQGGQRRLIRGGAVWGSLPALPRALPARGSPHPARRRAAWPDWNRIHGPRTRLLFSNLNWKPLHRSICRAQVRLLWGPKWGGPLLLQEAEAEGREPRGTARSAQSPRLGRGRRVRTHHPA